jgi:hypothetical protein
MTTRPKVAPTDALTPELALAELVALGVESRRATVAKDVRSRSPRYRCVPAHDLADALGIPESRRPGSEWSFTRYARLMTVEEYAQYNSPASEVIYMIEDSLNPEPSKVAPVGKRSSALPASPGGMAEQRCSQPEVPGRAQQQPAGRDQHCAARS